MAASRYNQLAVTRTFLTCVLLSAIAAPAQQATILLDPARGGAESGVRIGDRVDEKQVTLNLAQRLAPLLRARGFNVEMTRDADVDATGDARAALANTTHPLACVLLHATPAGSGVHLYSTALRQQYAGAGAPVRWDEAQAAFADRSRALREDMRGALERAKIAASAGQTWMRPLDNMQCAAVAIEVGPKNGSTGADSDSYQTQIANAIAGALLQWQGQAPHMAPAEPPAPPTVPKVKPATPALTAAPSPEVQP